MCRSRGLRRATRLLFSVTKGSDVSLWTFSLQDRKATPFGDVHSSTPTGARVLARWTMGGLREHRTGHDDDLRPAIPSHWGQVSAPLDQGSTARTRWLVTGRKGTVLQSEARRVRGRQRHDATDVCLRECRDGAADRSELGLPTRATPYDITPDGRFVGLDHQRDKSSPARPALREIQVVLNWFEELRARVPAK